MTATAVAAPPRVRSRGLDLLRGVAVALVIAHHSLERLLPSAGVVGVVLFFVLSGYLITGVLSRDLGSDGRLDLRAFYRRRAARLGPALLLLLLGLTAVTLTLDPLDDRHLLAGTWLRAVTFTGDLPLGRSSDAAFALWTLALEEQFYLLWPTVLAWAWRRRAVGRTLVVVAAVCWTAAAATTWWFRHDPDLAYVLPTSWAGCFVVGAALRLCGDRLAVAPRLVAAAVGVLALASVLSVRGHLVTYVLVAPLIAVAGGVLVLALRRRPVRAPVGRALAALGVVSYAAYLWNYPIVLWLRGTGGWGLLAVPLTLMAAVASTRLVEEPILRRLR